jgi:hypothetical protein
MSKKITIEIDAKYQDDLDMIKAMFPDDEGKLVTDNGEIIEELIESFLVFLEQQQKAMAEQENTEGGHVHGEHCNH